MGTKVNSSAYWRTARTDWMQWMTTESTNCKNLFQENILQAHMKYVGFSQETENSYCKTLVWSFDPSAKDKWLHKWTNRLEQRGGKWSFLTHSTAKSPSLGLLPPGRRQRASGPQQQTAWSIMNRIITVPMQLDPNVPMSKFQFQRRTVNPSIKASSWTVMISHRSSIHYQSALHYKLDQW